MVLIISKRLIYRTVSLFFRRARLQQAGAGVRPIHLLFMEIIRCPWPANHKLAIAYHDEEWGVPVHDDYKHFEYLLLDAFQAGLSWNTILNKRENFRKAFENFDFEKIAKYNDKKIEQLLNDAGIIRNRLKINSTISNAIAFMKVRAEFGSFDHYIWNFIGGKPIINQNRGLKDIPPKTALSDAMSKDLLKRGFRFVGSTICYSYMQAAGLVNDHIIDCYRHQPLSKLQ
jgi:DNA-3-methyladenine glycosylase I